MIDGKEICVQVQALQGTPSSLSCHEVFTQLFAKHNLSALFVSLSRSSLQITQTLLHEWMDTYLSAFPLFEPVDEETLHSEGKGMLEHGGGQEGGTERRK